MPFIKVLKKGAFPSLDGDKAYETIEVDHFGIPVSQKGSMYKNPIMKSVPSGGQPRPRSYKSRTEPKIGDGIRAPDYEKGFKEGQNFNYHQWNALKKKGLLKRYKK